MSRKPKAITLNKQLLLQSVLILIAVPALILLAFNFLGDEYYHLTACLIILMPILSLFVGFERQSLNAQNFIILSVFIALTVVSRAAFFIIPQFKPIIALVIISGICLGTNQAFIAGSMSAFLSNFFFGQGPWTIFQMFALGLVGFLAGLIFYNRLNFSKLKNLIIIAIFGFISTSLYSVINNFSFLLISKIPPSFEAFFAICALSLPMDTVLAAATVIFLIVFTKPMDSILKRIKTNF